MPKEYDAETKAKAVRLVQDHREDYASEYEAIRTVVGPAGDEPGDAAEVAAAGRGRRRPGRGHDDGGGPARSGS